MIAPAESSPGLKVAEFAWRLKNYARPLGLLNLGLPCQLMGTGMAFPWPVISTINVATGNVVEDLKLGLDLAEFDRPALFCPDALVTSVFPRDRDAARLQRQRWEHGQLRTLLSNGPRLLAKAARLRRVDLLAIALDLIVPPLSVLGGLLIAAAGLSLGVMALWGGAFPIGIAACACASFFVALCLGWYRYGRDLVPINSFHLIASYLGSKVALYADGLLRGSARKWIRTDRD
jgi:cellulose synthase/poly-beta-1,6-N-acetylglucosamine synthase-like glycosyltransferase